MIEIIGNLWDHYEKPNKHICITTNGTRKKNGEAVMGRGCALEAKKKIPGIAAFLGQHIAARGVTAGYIGRFPLIAFPVKYQWFEKANLDLIGDSCNFLRNSAIENPLFIFVLPRPGCGNGHRSYKNEVRPILMNWFKDIPNIYVISKSAGEDNET